MRDVGVTRVIAPDTATYAHAYQAASREFKDRFGDDALTGIHCTSPDTMMPDGNSCGYGQLTHATEFGQAMCRQTGMTCGDQNTFARIMAMAAAGGMMSGNGTGGRGPAGGNGPRFTTTSTGVTIDRASVSSKVAQTQGRHVLGHNNYSGGSYFNSATDAQRVLDDFHSGHATVLGLKRNGDIVVRTNSVTGFNHNPRSGYPNQPTNVFFIKGTSSPSVVPYTPGWGS